MDTKTEKLLIALARLIADNTGTSASSTDLIAAVADVELSVDENKAQVDLVTVAINQLITQSFGGDGWDIAGGITTETLTIAGGSGTLGIDITSGSHALISYDEAWDTGVEVTIDNWVVTNAALMLAAHGITATKASTSTILLTGSVRAGIWTFADGGATMTATSGGQSTASNTATGPYSVIEVIADAVFDHLGTVQVIGDELPFGHPATAGTKIVGNFTSVKLVSGVALCYLF
ncbi:hypothetical protein LCGC14_2873370 [marine sediment metagenome]|uniref:Uncharacterized protein n=1 Tax=marine sediment metagenome TaxID=412755 RepID=A0A0F9ATH3_9ZZZZ